MFALSLWNVLLGSPSNYHFIRTTLDPSGHKNHHHVYAISRCEAHHNHRGHSLPYQLLMLMMTYSSHLRRVASDSFAGLTRLLLLFFNIQLCNLTLSGSASSIHVALSKCHLPCHLFTGFFFLFQKRACLWASVVPVIFIDITVVYPGEIIVYPGEIYQLGHTLKRPWSQTLSNL